MAQLFPSKSIYLLFDSKDSSVALLSCATQEATTSALHTTPSYESDKHP